LPLHYSAEYAGYQTSNTDEVFGLVNGLYTFILG